MPAEIDWDAVEESPVRCADAASAEKMVAAIDEARNAGDTLGGVVEGRVERVPMGLGSHVHWDRKIDGRLAQALMSIHSVKGVEIGGGFAATRTTGSKVHDVILPREQWRRTARGRAPRTTPAAPKAASPTARTSSCASH